LSKRSPAVKMTKSRQFAVSSANRLLVSTGMTLGLPVTVAGPNGRKFGGLSAETGPTLPLAKAPTPIAYDESPL
jgi:hypothetical protein